jgi:hypothetical protein
MSKQFIEVDVDVKAQTDKAWLCSNGDVDAWIPVSQIDDYCKDDDTGVISSIFITEWLATEKGLI